MMNIFSTTICPVCAKEPKTKYYDASENGKYNSKYYDALENSKFYSANYGNYYATDCSDHYIYIYRYISDLREASLFMNNKYLVYYLKQGNNIETEIYEGRFVS